MTKKGLKLALEWDLIEESASVSFYFCTQLSYLLNFVVPIPKSRVATCHISRSVLTVFMIRGDSSINKTKYDHEAIIQKETLSNNEA